MSLVRRLKPSRPDGRCHQVAVGPSHQQPWQGGHGDVADVQNVGPSRGARVPKHAVATTSCVGRLSHRHAASSTVGYMQLRSLFRSTHF